MRGDTVHFPAMIRLMNCARFSSFSADKIRFIHEGLEKVQDTSFTLDPDTPFVGTSFSEFSPLSEEEVSKLIKDSAPKTSCLDPVPSKLVKECLDVLVPIITRIINQSFADGYVPKSFKLAAVIPLLKKIDLIPEILKNFRPISNLPYLSKILEKAATKQLIQHKDSNNLREKMASAYREHHSTETALLRVSHDLLMSMDRKKCILMVMLDLSAAFDTVNHDVLLERLSVRYGVKDTAHNWIQSYLHERRQFILIDGHRSQEQVKQCDVPQGSVLGPNLYEDYTAAPIGDIFRKHGISFSIYADDKLAYLEFDHTDIVMALQQLEICLQEVRIWMARNWLKLNDLKTEFIIFGAKKYLSVFQNATITIGDCSISSVKSVKSIGAHLDNNLTMDNQIAATCRSAWFYLYQIGKIRKYLTEEQTKTVVHAYVTSRLDMNNSLLLGVAQKKLKRLQMVQHAAARMITGLKKRDHITPALRDLHWLPIEKRILYKVLLLVFKSMHGKGPAYLAELLPAYVPSRSLRSSSDNMLVVPKCKYVETEKRAFGVRGPKEWNKLPAHLRTKTSIESFKTALKTFLFSDAFKQ